MKRTFLVTDPDGSRRTIELHGRNAWALSKLIDASEGGSTSIDNPAPRLSGYVLKSSAHIVAIEVYREAA